MSRKGKLPIALPKGVEVKVDGLTVSVKGPKGSLSEDVRKGIEVSVDGEQVLVTTAGTDKESGSLHGLYRSLIQNMVTGVTDGFERKLEMIGVGYRAAVKGNDLELLVGLSHPVALPIPQGITVTVDRNTRISLTGSNKQELGQFAATIRATRPPEPYKGKGVRYEGEFVRRKAGKSGKK